MKFFLSIAACASLAASSFAAPAIINKRACADTVDSTTIGPATTIVTSLKSTVDQYSSAISTAHTAFVSSGDKATASTAYQSAISSLTSAFSDASSQVVDLTGVSVEKVKTDDAACIASVVKRQTSLETELEEILEELTTAIQTIVGDLGLTSALSFLNPLLAALGNLLLALIPVVNNLLALVEELLDGLLTGLGLGLIGIVLRK